MKPMYRETNEGSSDRNVGAEEDEHAVKSVHECR